MLDDFFAWAEGVFERVREVRGPLASAFGNAIRQREALRRFLDDVLSEYSPLVELVAARILEDLERFPGSSKADIWRRVGPEIPERTFRRALEELIALGRLVATGETRARKFSLKPGVSGHGDDDGQ